MSMIRISQVPPAWLTRPAPQTDAKRRAKYERSKAYFLQMWRATPDWYRNDPEMLKKFYVLKREAKRLRKQGFDIQVDHIVPLRSKYVCGLNAHWNLQLVYAEPNRKKSNDWWPDCPWQNEELFSEAEAPHQLRLVIVDGHRDVRPDANNLRRA